MKETRAAQKGIASRRKIGYALGRNSRRDADVPDAEQLSARALRLQGIQAGTTCPNRDGHCGTGGCIFCAGSGEFAESEGGVAEQLARAKRRVAAKAGKDARYIAYFQSYTATYAPVSELEARFSAAMAEPDVAALSIATRPDCLPPEVLALLAALNREKPVFVELGLQTIHPASARWMRRGYDLPVYDAAVEALRARDLEVVTHMIAGLPGETPEMIADTARYIGKSGAQGIKIHLLHVLRGTDLAKEYEMGRVPLPTMEEYIEIAANCLRVLPPAMVIHRLTGDGDKRTLLAPLWSADKKTVLNAMNRALRDVRQGELL